MKIQEFIKHNTNIAGVDKQAFENDLDSLIEYEIKEFVNMVIYECFPRPCSDNREIFITKERLKRLGEKFIPH